MSSQEVVELEDADEFPCVFTGHAVQMALDALADEGLSDAAGIRVGVRGGGCAGFSYVLDFSDKPNPGDFSYKIQELRVYVDPMSAMHLDGTTIDYVMGLMGSGFKFNNPHAKKTCGCGSSFG
jgi:iron-sulfur cluster assembly protein